MKSLFLWLVGLSILCGMPCVTTKSVSAQSKEPIDIPKTMNEIRSDIEENNLLPAVTKIGALAEEQKSMSGLAAQYFAIVGDYERAERLFHSTIPRPTWSAKAIENPATSAIPTLIEAAKSSRVVIINEAHHLSQHRAFIHRLMVSLRGVGFTHFAAETFCTTCDQIAIDGVPTVSSGFYVLDPVFGDITRQAVREGYQLVAYEIRPDQVEASYPSMEARSAAREFAQARNLAELFESNPLARVLVHVGFGHVTEGETFDVEMFASRFKALTGIDPITIDQYETTPSTIDPEFDPPLYKAYVSHFGEPKSELAIANSITRPLGRYTVDFSVLHPRATMVQGRPSWLAIDGYRRPQLVEFDPVNERTLIRAFAYEEPENAVPMDQILTEDGANQVWLMLPKGKYRIVRQFLDGKSIFLNEIEIN